jgi:uncharacterized protein YggU (UPF0235/DUF167 family)
VLPLKIFNVFMKLFIKVKTNSSKPCVEKIDDNSYLVKVREMPIKGRANEAVIKALANHLGIAGWRIKITGGLISKNKVLEVI